MIAKMIDCNNPSSAGYAYVGKTGVLTIADSVFYFNSLRSSVIQSTLRHEDKLIIKTLNTTYTFQIKDTL